MYSMPIKKTTLPTHELQKQVSDLLARSRAIHHDFKIPGFESEDGIEGTLDLLRAGLEQGCLVVCRKVDDHVAITFRDDLLLDQLNPKQ